MRPIISRKNKNVRTLEEYIINAICCLKEQRDNAKAKSLIRKLDQRIKEWEDVLKEL